MDAEHLLEINITNIVFVTDIYIYIYIQEYTVYLVFFFLINIINNIFPLM